MCHNQKPGFFPALKERALVESNDLKYWRYAAQSEDNPKQLLILTDIYGCNEFYQGLSSYWAERGWEVLLLDLFIDLWELKEITREAAFERRHELKDKLIVDSIQGLIQNQKVDAVIGFCLGGNYVLELARRNTQANLVGYYPFPAGLQNQDQLTPAFDYMGELTQPVTILTAALDDSAGRENIARFAEQSRTIDALEVIVYQNSGHGFLTNLDSEDTRLRDEARDSLDKCEAVISAR